LPSPCVKEYELLKIIKLKEIKLNNRTSRNREHTFAILLDQSQKKTMYLQAGSDEERQEWLDAFVQAGAPAASDHQLLGLPEPQLAGSDSNTSLNTPSTPVKKAGPAPDDDKDRSPKAGRKSIDQGRGYFSDDNDNENTSESEGELPNRLEKVMAEGVVKQGYLLKQTVVRKVSPPLPLTPPDFGPHITSLEIYI